MDDQMLHHFMQDLFPIIIMPVMIVAMAWVIGAIIGAFKHRAQLRAQSELHNKLLDKFGSAQEFTTCIQSEGGRTFFDRLTTEPVTPLTGIINSIKIGVILSLLGLGIFATRDVFGTSDSKNIMLIVSTVAFTVGVGFLVSSVISYRLAKVWGLISPVNQRVKTDSSQTSVTNK